MTLENLTMKARNNIGLPKLTITAETFACQSHGLAISVSSSAASG
jgi:hypothetical protein